MKYVLLALHVVFSLALMWACFCRATRTSKQTTRYEVVLAFWGLGTAAALSFVAPWGSFIWPELFISYSVTWIDVFQLGTIVAVLTVSSKGWQRDIPPPYRKGKASTP